ncbi:MAG: rRNA processing protein RimM [Actinomycetota bacterium]|nr:rRNA processing protein RimM [Actinomycetota bacterium]HQZ87016.1 ribosome maturation factor RimM [Actinomycetota bacterium]
MAAKPFGSTSSTWASADLRVVVGRIGRAHGLRGDVAVEVRTDDPGLRFSPGALLYVAAESSDGAKDPARPETLVVVAARWHSGRLLLRFEGIVDRDAAERVRGLLLEVEQDPAELPLTGDEFYDHQLVGLAAHLMTGELLGSVTDVLHVPGQDLLVVTTEDGEAMIPFVAEIVTEVDIATGRLVVDPPEGLI